jgi:arabinofuranan 3-O-arabinosyltransferase
MRAATARGGAGQSGFSLNTLSSAALTQAASSKVAPLSRRWLWLVAAVALALSFAQSPGQISPDTKLDLTANPLRFLARATNLWNSELPFGQAQNQAYGYLFPHGSFFLIGHLLGLPGWVTQRLWWALLLSIGFWGLLRIAEALGIGSPTSRAIAAAAFARLPPGSRAGNSTSVIKRAVRASLPLGTYGGITASL